MELDGKKGLLVTGQSRRTSSVQTVCRCLPVLTEFRGSFGPKKGFFRAENAQFWEGTSKLGAPAPRAPPVSFWLKTWIWQDHHLGSRMVRIE